MEFEVKVWCSECGSEISEKEDVACNHCFQNLKDEITDLTKQVDQLEIDVEACEKELQELR